MTKKPRVGSKRGKAPKAERSEISSLSLREHLDLASLCDQLLASPNNTDANRQTLLRTRALALSFMASRFSRSEPRALDYQARLAAEPQLWANVSATASAALDFWVDYFGLLWGATNDQLLGATEKGRFLCIIRAVSWTESRHGDDTSNGGDVDPMQMSNPNDPWWKSLTKHSTSYERFVGSAQHPNKYSYELMAAASGSIPADADPSSIDWQLGHNDPGFKMPMSYYFGIPYLLHRINTFYRGQFYKCGNIVRDELFEGAVRYNANPAVEPNYRQRLTDNLNATGCLP